MCGLTGYWAPGGVAVEEGRAVGAAMAARIAHRGPDDYGVWCDPQAGVVLAHRRLSILDLSPAGHQPMSSPAGRFVVVFNGEIYNHAELRREVSNSSNAPRAWRGHSDTEVLLAAFEAWGVEATLVRTVGMFALAVWDARDRALHLARDRMGEKPLYYGWQNGVFLFGSELRALGAHPAFAGEVDRDALALLLGHNYIPAPSSICTGVHKLLPAHCLCLREGDRDPEVRPYWSLKETALAGQADLFQGDDEEAVSELERILGDAVSLQMVADVPLGAFLSGGVDSSAVVALMQARSRIPVRTFTIGFNEPAWNEAIHARAVASHLGTDHNELYVSAADALGVVPELARHYDEPLADASQIPTILVARLARQHVTVSLSGDGGDELFGGYERYFLARRLWDRVGAIPTPLRRVLAHGLDRSASAAGVRQLVATAAHLPGPWRGRPVGERLRQAAELLRADVPEDIFRSVVTHWRFPATVVAGARERPTPLSAGAATPRLAEFEHRMMYLDAVTYLCDDVLAKVDRAAMSVSLESRVPMLDHRVVEFAWRLPLRLKIRDGRGKWVLRRLLERHVPRTLIDRPKVGFGVPLATWLRGDLRDWAEALLDESRLRREGFLDAPNVRRRWSEHQSGVQNWHYSLWSILMFQAWLEARRGEANPAN